MTSALGVHALAAAMLRCRVFSMQKQGAQSSPAWWCLNPEVSFAADLHGRSCIHSAFFQLCVSCLLCNRLVAPLAVCLPAAEPVGWALPGLSFRLPGRLCCKAALQA